MNTRVASILYSCVFFIIIANKDGFTGNTGSDSIAIKTVFLEAGGERNPLLSMQAVGEVIRARAKGRSYESVCLEPYQFSCWNNLWKARQRLKTMTAKDWQLASKSWYESEYSNLVRGSQFYYNPSLVRPAWRNDKGMIKIGMIGNHLFILKGEI